jgi:ABC-2 type transport system permease protein
VLGPLWISISMGVIATAMGILYGALFGEPIQTFLPYVATGLLIWNFISGCILEGSEVFIANEGLIRFLPAPLERCTSTGWCGARPCSSCTTWSSGAS